jgi:two-component system cell cycle response regulator DivK
MSSVVLIVEDNALNRELLRAVLTRCGHAVVEAASVAEAKEMLACSAPALALVDIQIPGGSGEDVLRAIRASPTLARICVVAVTAFAMQHDRERLLEAGFDDYVSKPIDTRRLAVQLDAWLSGAPPGPRTAE